MFDLAADASARTVISSRILDAPRDRVFDAYADPAKLVRWWGPIGFTMKVEQIDLREGGHWRFVFTGPDGKTFKNHLVFKTIDRPSRFVVDHLSGPNYRGTVTFDDLGGRTRVTMYWTFESQTIHDKIRDAVAAGNEGNLDRLSAVVSAS